MCKNPNRTEEMMAKKVNKRGAKIGNPQSILKKEKQNDKSLFKKTTSENDASSRKSLSSRTFLFMDGMRPFPIALLGLFSL